MHPRAMTFADIEGLTEDQIIALAERIREEKGEPEVGEMPSFLAKMKQIKIDAPADFSSQVLKARHGDSGADES